MSVPRLPVDAAVAEVGVRARVGVPIDADAAGASVAIPASTASCGQRTPPHSVYRHELNSLSSPCFRAADASPPDAARARHRVVQEFLMTMPSRMFAALSVASIAASRRSNRSFQRITTIGSMPPSNRDATASRVIRSPSFSSRLTSTV